MRREKRDRRLWHRLEGYSFHERPLTRSLIDRLHEESGHSIDVCYTLVEEYRRFMYLVGCTGETLAPSPIVALVWRLHISDEKAYFQDFCPRVIGRTIHYAADPLPIGEDPAYERTLEFYAREFGRAQVQYWPDPDVGAVNLSSFLMWSVGLTAFALALLIGSIIFAAFGAFVITGSMFLRWKFSSLPLQNLHPETE
ncbi:hypothetical protein [Yoonia sediminilitoris]|uniref:Uncharacterized protein n=1 Tax=Yoonia sediminilitoris TaxID=1286148 RepID=A0A2T6KQI7_9RHOB|nr:hypothetical protein [Yoonia sediminilitoris]PUB18821.1 hypothetical protein C8N45_101410 [Yoonia sediminilitoris]RCW98989.1 hypothetical protein DFP92_101410 [Yoonia sediminilitoris]